LVVSATGVDEEDFDTLGTGAIQKGTGGLFHTGTRPVNQAGRRSQGAKGFGRGRERLSEGDWAKANLGSPDSSTGAVPRAVGKTSEASRE
jgi:hypothetical protein